jgi:hypothetical protein
LARTSLLTVTTGVPHTLLLGWDPLAHLLLVQVDDQPPAVVDPTLAAPGFPVASGPKRPFWQLAAHATAAGPGLDFTTGSVAAVRARFDDVRN